MKKLRSLLVASSMYSRHYAGRAVRP